MNKQELLDYVDDNEWEQTIQADEDQLMEFLQKLLEPLDAVAKCCGGNLLALRIVRTAKLSGGSIVQTTIDLAEKSQNVRRFQMACEPHGVAAVPDVYSFQDLWLYERACSEGLSTDRRLEAENGEYFIVRVFEDGVRLGHGDGYHRSFVDPMVLWDEMGCWIREFKKFVEVAEVQTR